MCEVKESCYFPYYRKNYNAERLNQSSKWFAAVFLILV